MANKALKQAIKIAGGQTDLARLIGTSQQAVYYWLTASKRGVPAEFVLPIQRATGVPCHELRPDIFEP